jgi:hypothetical protein
MMTQIVEAHAVGPYRLQLRFSDGVEGVIDVAKLVPFDGVFEPLRDQGYFAQVKVHPELMTVCWPNGADLDPDVLYSVVTGAPVEQAMGRT